MGCSYSTKKFLLYVFTMLFLGFALYWDLNFFVVIGAYLALTPCMFCWLSSGHEHDVPHFPYNRPIRSIYPNPDPNLGDKMAERALELEEILEGAMETPIEESLIPDVAIANALLRQSNCKRNTCCDLSVELNLSVESIVKETQKQEGKTSNKGEGDVQKKSDLDAKGIEEYPKRDEDHQEFSLDRVPLEFLYAVDH